jgi:glycosyltransferase involved in cell wall biosynthesis
MARRLSGGRAHRPLRVALVGNWPPRGGVAEHVAALARSLRARGVDAVVLDVGASALRRVPGVRPARGLAPYTAALAWAAAERRLVHVHTTGANPKSWLVALAGGRARVPGAPHGVLTIHSGTCPAWLAASAARRRLAALACAGYGRVIAVSPEIAAALRGAGVPAGKVVVLSPWSPSLLDPPRAPARLAPFRDARAPLFAAALAPGPIYGGDLLLPAFAALRLRLPDAGLVVFGPGTEGLAGEGLLALGQIPHAEALGVLAAADVFVRPTRADGDALTVREALAAGRRVVASAVGNRPPGCLLFPSGDGEALARALEAAPGAPAPPAARAVSDPFGVLIATYRALCAARPLPDGGPEPAHART